MDEEALAKKVIAEAASVAKKVLEKARDTATIVVETAQKIVEDNYTKRELDDHFREVKDELHEIKIQVMKTNGRVSTLETWRAYLVGGVAVIVATVVPLIIYIWTHAVK